MPTARPSAHSTTTQLAGGIAAIALIVAALGFTACAAIGGAGSGTGEAANAPAAEAPADTHPRASFVAVGDNLPDDAIGAYADAQAGTVGDGAYDYARIYEPVKPAIEAADLAYVKQETHLGGDDIGPKGYPSFNTTDAMADAIVSTGFDMVASASNHAYDWGAFGANEHSRSVWNGKPVVYTGTATSEEEAAQISTVERNGITFSLLDYTYGVNGYSKDDLPPYAVNFIDKERIATDVARAREASDVVLVAMHWGTENLTEVDDMQREYAQYLADLGVDVVLGSHPHVIGPMAWVDGKDGHRTLVAYSLGNFLSNHEAPGAENELEGMLSCDFVRNDDNSVSIENVAWTPLVNHTNAARDTFAVYPAKDYTADLAAEHPVFSQMDDPLAWVRDTTAEIVGREGGEFEIKG